ncbi:MAG: fumarylacetoacetate hydrolase family protein, partial [Gammaproteobacteria bacterium]|nr:fumarylacetoacetate hydrolase family protein [Gammaproteobacteria bacterium]
VDLSARLDAEARSLKALIAAGTLEQAGAAAAAAPADFRLNEIEYLPPIARPGKIICIGVNYGNRNAEYRDDSDAPKYPSVFMRTPESLVGHGQTIMRPPESEQLDYEGEIVLVIGKPGRRIARESAWSHVAGLSLMNEGSVRDWLRHAKFNVTQGKNFERSGSWGPWIVGRSAIERGQALHLTTHVNGEPRQDDTTDNLIFPFDYLISYLSSFMPLNPGDIIATGTPTGAGARFDPPKYLKDGDTVTVHVPELGTLENRIQDEIV